MQKKCSEAPRRKFIYYSNLLQPRYKGMLLTPFPEYILCAKSMNDYHLVLMMKLIRAVDSGIIYPKGFSQTPIVALWRDTPMQVKMYAMLLANEASKRKFDPQTMNWINGELKHYRGEYKWVRDNQRQPDAPPFWLGDLSWHRYHRGLMHENDPAFYTAVYLKTQVGTNFETEYQGNPDLIFKNDNTQYERQRITAWVVNRKTADQVADGK